MQDHRTILRRMQSPSPSRDSQAPKISLPPDLLEKARHRVKLVALLVLGAHLLVLLSDLPTEGFGALVESLNEAAGWAVILLSCALFGFAASKRFPSQLILNLGLLYQVVICLLLSFTIPWTHHVLAIELGIPDRVTDLLPFTTWVTPIIIMFPLIIPSRPTRTLLIALASAATVPLGLFVLDTAGPLDVEFRAYPHTFLSPIMAVAIAYVGSRVLYNIGLDVTRARQMGSYHLESQLGAGGVGEVWRARHRMLARPAAIKLIKPEVLGAAGPESQTVVLRRFEREAQTTALLRSPHTIELYDFGVTDDGTFYYVMELLEGLDLERLGRKFGPAPPGRAIHLLHQMCHSLAEAHANGLIHRDIKPANIYTCRYGREVDFVKVLDFGLVKTHAGLGAVDAKLTAAKVAGGTPAYMAPEQVLGTTVVDARTDIYAVGCVAYWLLTGSMVFEGENAMQTMMHHAQTQPAPPSASSELAIPAALDELVLRCLEKDPDQRPQSADQLAAMLHECRLDQEWTQERARRWWDTHQPAPDVVSS
jgi:hypothetical protein